MNQTAYGNAFYIKRHLWAQTLLCMKLTALLLFVACLHVSAKTHSQKVTLSGKNLSLEQILEMVKKQTGYDAVYNPDLLKTAKRISIHIKDTNLQDALQYCFEDQLVDFQIRYNTIVVVSKAKEKPSVLFTQSPGLYILPVEISGRVFSETGEPLQGVSISIKGTTKGTTTGNDGSFVIAADPGDVLIISFVGYIPQEITVAQNKTLSVKLKQAVTEIEQAVVIGYGTQSQGKVTGAISSLTNKDINAVAVTGLDQAMQGRLAGIHVTQNSGDPGGSISVKIRGVGSINSSTEPLYVVDGIPLAGGLNAINPNDIDRIDVLKDAASAAIYGSRGTNGVVLVTTKKGKAGKVKINVDAYAGTQNAAKKISLLNGPQFAKLANENLSNANYATNPAWNNPESQPTYDWQDAIFQTSPIQNYNVSISGGGDRSRTFFSLGYFQQGGIIIGSNYDRYTARLNTEYNVSRRFTVGATVSLAYEEKQSITTDHSFGGILTNVAELQPTSPIYTDQTGNINNNFFGWNGYNFTSRTATPNFYVSNINNEVYIYKEGYIKMPSNSFQVLAAAYGEVELLKGLKFRSTMNVSAGNSFNQRIQKKSPAEISNVGQYLSVSTYNEGWNTFRQWNWINTLSYLKEFGNHTVELTGGTDALKNTSRYVYVLGTNNEDGQNSIDATDNIARRTAAGSPSDFSLVSYFGRITYDYDKKYLFTANFRRDGSSKFGPNKKYGSFPSASVGWRVSRENFMSSVHFINDLKLRASYGIVGNQNIPNFKYLSTYSNAGGRYQYVIGADQTPVPAMFADNIGDPDIHWEKSEQTDFGLDAALLGGKLTFTADYYLKKISDLLGFYPLPNYTGVYGNSVLINSFSMQNSGLELQLGYHNRAGEIAYSVNANFSTLNNKVTKLTESEKSYISQSISVGRADDNAQTRSQAGERIANFWGYVTDGIFQNEKEINAGGMGGVSPGDRRYKDLTGDSIVNADDKAILGNGLPRYTFGVNVSMSYKNFDLSVFLNGQAGVQIANMTKSYLYNMRFFGGTGIVNGSTDLLNSWHGEGTSNVMPRNSYDAPGSNRYFSSYYIENGAFLRIRNIQLGYTLPARWFSKIGMSQGRIYVSAQNLHTFTKYSGYDPEVGSSNVNLNTNQSPLTSGVDYGRYPVSRIFMAGINFQF